MEAELVRELPTGDGWQYEPKWDGFRGVLENDGGELALWSRNERPLLRYFPELRPLGDLLPAHSALDGEIVISRDGVLDFDAMQTRLHPAESRVRKLSAEIPAIFIAFDLLLWDGKRAQAAARRAARGAAARRRGLLDLPRRPGARRGDRLARPLRGDRPRRRDREAARPALPARLPRGRRQGEGAQDGRLRRHRHPLEGEADPARDAPARALPRGRRDGLRRLCGGRRPQPRRDPRARAPARRRVGGTPLLGAQPLGHRRPRAERAAPRARRRGALRQGAGEPLQARHEADPLPAGQGSRAVHLARAPARAAAERPHGRGAAGRRG